MNFDINNPKFIGYLFNPIIIIVSLFMITFSILIFYITFTKCDFKLPEMVLIIIMNFIHFFCGVFGLVFAILKLVLGHDYLKGGSIQCLLYSFIVNSSNRLEIFTVGFLAIMRYLISCHSIKKSTRFWLICYLCVITPILAFYLFPLITRDGNPLPSMLFCAPFLKPTAETFALSMINPFIFIIPCWSSTYCYFVIGTKAYKKLKQMENEASSSNDDYLVNIIKAQKISLIFQLTIVFIVFNISFMPVYVTIILRVTTGYKRSPIADAIMGEIIEISRAIDPIITIIFQPELTHEFKVFITKFKANVKRFWVNLFK